MPRLLAAHKARPPACKRVCSRKRQLKCAPHQEAAKNAPAHVPDLCNPAATTAQSSLETLQVSACFTFATTTQTRQ